MYNCGKLVVVGINSISLDLKERKLTIIGNMDPMEVVAKLRKTYRTDVVTIGPAKEPEKPKEEKPKEKEPQVTPNVNGYMSYNPYSYPITKYYYCYEEY